MLEEGRTLFRSVVSCGLLVHIQLCHIQIFLQDFTYRFVSDVYGHTVSNILRTACYYDVMEFLVGLHQSGVRNAERYLCLYNLWWITIVLI